MQLLDDDMDELFRQAAEDYPLHLQKGDWDLIAGKMASSGIVAQAGSANNNNDKKSYWILLLILLITALSGALIVSISRNNKNTVAQIAYQQNNKKESEANKEIASLTQQTIADAITDKKGKNVRPVLSEKISVTDVANSNLSPTQIQQYTDGVAKLLINVEAPGIAQKNTVSENSESSKDTNSISKKEDIPVAQTEARLQDKKPSKNKILYAGFFTGPQFNQVKNQGFGQTSIYTGLVAGVHLTNKLSVEAGLFVSEKKYSSNGKYFDMTKVAPSMPAGMTLETLTGHSTVFEIPLKLKYNFFQKKNNVLFMTTGISSYILTHESNKYLAMINGNQEKLSGNYPATNKYLGSSIQISTGYEYKTGKKITIRVEPYIQIPLKGIGVGSLPVMSTGVNLGVTIPMFR